MALSVRLEITLIFFLANTINKTKANLAAASFPAVLHSSWLEAAPSLPKGHCSDTVASACPGGKPISSHSCFFPSLFFLLEDTLFWCVGVEDVKISTCVSCLAQSCSLVAQDWNSQSCPVSEGFPLDPQLTPPSLCFVLQAFAGALGVGREYKMALIMSCFSFCLGHRRSKPMSRSLRRNHNFCCHAAGVLELMLRPYSNPFGYADRYGTCGKQW